MIFSVNKQGIRYSTYKDAFYENVYFEIENTKRNSIFIGEEYVFTNYSPSKKKGLKESKGSFVVKRKSDGHKAFTDGSVGLVSFFEEYASEFGDFYSPPSIVFEVYVDDKAFDEIKDSVKRQLNTTYVTVECDRGMDFGWEPDGSSRVWKTNESKTGDMYSRLVNVEITSFGMGFGEETNHDDDDNEATSSLTTPQEILSNVKRIHGYVKQIGYALIVICVVVVLQALI
jgi:hypothetical protein